jgi:hypothetical protein
MKPIVLLLLTLLAKFASAQEAAKPSATETEQRVFSKVPRVGEDSLRSFFMFSVSGHDYTIRADGRGERSFDNARSRNFNLKVDQSHIEQVYFLEHDGDLLLLYQLSDKQSVRGYVVRLNQTTLKPVWMKAVSGLDFETEFVEAGYLNLKAANVMVKMDLRSGALVEN